MHRIEQGAATPPRRAVARLIAFVLLAASHSQAGPWVIVRKDGSRIECGGPYVIVNGAYTFPSEEGEPISIPVDEVDALKTDAANSGVSTVGPSGTPLAVSRPVAIRRPAGDLLVTFHPPYAKPPGSDWSYSGVHPSEERFFVYVPASYTGHEPFGLIVYSDPEDNTTIPPGWEAALEERKLLFVAAQGSGKSQRLSRRMGLAVLGALQMKKQYYIDPDRVYAAGFSSGASLANELAFYGATLFDGAIMNSGAEFYERVPHRPSAGPADLGSHAGPPGLVRLPPKQMTAVKRKMRFAMITGSRDSGRSHILDIYYGGYRARGFQARLFDIEGMGHEPCPAPALAQVIDFLDGR